MLRFFAGMWLVGVLSSPAVACCMLPSNYLGTISQKAHEAVIIHDAGREELVLRIDYKIAGESMPDNFAWVITVPNEPDAYALADEKLFGEMSKLSRKLRPPSWGRFGGGMAAVAGGVELGKRVQVGPYDIQPVRGVGANALSGLNAWLKSKGYPTEDPEHMRYFVDNHFTFLCIKIAAPKGEKTVVAGGKVRPLHLSFASQKPYYPLRFSSRQGVFDVDLHVLTASELDYPSSDRVLRQINWSNERFERNYQLREKEMPESLKKVFTNSRMKTDHDVWYYSNIRGDRLNSNNAIASWTTDVFFGGLPLTSNAAQAPSTVKLSKASLKRIERIRATIADYEKRIERLKQRIESIEEKERIKRR